MPTRGIDLSHWNNIHSWDALEEYLRNQCNNGFVLLKAGGNEHEKFYTDKALEKNIAQCKNRGIPYGLYFYAGGHVSTAMRGRETAQQFLATISRLKAEDCRMGFWLDFEEGKSYLKVGNTDAAMNFCNYIQRNTSNDCGIYGSDIATFKNMLQIDRLEPYRKWVAKYSNKAPAYVKDWYIWQHTSKGIVPGVTGYCDMNVMHDF